ncbi:tripartite tricarboxylate transporter TctB family protein [Blastococcus sp. SYSU DS0533]
MSVRTTPATGATTESSATARPVAPGRGPGRRLAVAGVPSALGIGGLLLSAQLGVWDESLPGPGFYPLLASALITGAGVTLFLRQSDAELEDATPGETARVALGIGLLLAYAVLFPLLGVVTTSFVISLLWLKVLARESWRTSLAIAVGATAFIYVLFVRLLQLPLPLDAFLPR